MFSHHKQRVCVSTRTLGAMAAVALLWAPLASAETTSHQEQATIPQHVAMNHQLPGWAEQLKGQTIIEDTMAGKSDRAEDGPFA